MMERLSHVKANSSRYIEPFSEKTSPRKKYRIVRGLACKKCMLGDAVAMQGGYIWACGFVVIVFILARQPLLVTRLVNI